MHDFFIMLKGGNHLIKSKPPNSSSESCRTCWSFPTCHFLLFTECRTGRVHNNNACLHLVYNIGQSLIREMFNLVIMRNRCFQHDESR